MPNILLNMKPLIRIVRSAEARRFNTYLRHLSRKRPKRAEIFRPGNDKIWPHWDGLMNVQDKDQASIRQQNDFINPLHRPVESARQLLPFRRPGDMV
jgi:hypothetical protein